MKKTYFVFLTASLLSINAIAQSLQEGITHLYADRFKNAENTFQKILAVNPNVIEATYWLGQTYLDEDKNDEARQLYDKALTTNGNAPLLLVGRGHVDLIDGKTSDARQRFETALTLSRTKKGDDPAILTAIGRANVDAKKGDLAYAIEKLGLAVQRDPKKADAYLELGNAIRKANPGVGGGEAYTNYKKALEVDPNFVYAYIRIAKLFETQRNWELFLQNLNDAIAKDPNFSLAYYEMFYYYFYNQKYSEAEEYFKKYTNSRPNESQMEHDFLNSQLCWAKKDYECATAKAESAKAAMGERVKPRVLRLLSYSYLGKSDFTNAKKYIDEFFAREKDGFVPQDFKLKADIYAGAGVPCEEIYGIFLAGAAVDTVLQTKIDYLSDAADYFKTKNCKKQEADMRMVIYNTRSKPNPAVFINIGILYSQAGDFKKADSLFIVYNNTFPDSIYGYDWRGRVNFTLDTSMTVEPYVSNLIQSYQKTLAIAENDKIRFKPQGTRAALTLVGYFNNIKADRDSALAYAQRGLAFDTSNAQFKSIVDMLSKGSSKQPKTPSKTGNNKPTSKAIRPEAKDALAKK